MSVNNNVNDSKLLQLIQSRPGHKVNCKPTIFQEIILASRDYNESSDKTLKERVSELQKIQLRSLKNEIKSLENSLSAEIHASKRDQKKIQSLQKKLAALNARELELNALYTDVIGFLSIPSKNRDKILFLSKDNNFLESLSIYYNRECFEKLSTLTGKSADDLWYTLGRLTERQLSYVFNPEYISKLETLTSEHNITPDDCHFLLSHGEPEAILHFEEYSKAIATDQLECVHFTLVAAKVWAYSPAMLQKLLFNNNFIDLEKKLGEKGFNFENFKSLTKAQQNALADYLVIAKQPQIRFVNLCFEKMGMEHPVFAWILNHKHNAINLVQTYLMMELTDTSPYVKKWMMNPSRTLDELEMMQKIYHLSFNPKFQVLSKTITQDLLTGRDTPLLKLFSAGHVELCLRQFNRLRSAGKSSKTALQMEIDFIRQTKERTSGPNLEDVRNGLMQALNNASVWKGTQKEPFIAMEFARISAHYLITDQGYIDIEKLPELIATVKKTVENSGLNFYQLTYLVEHLEALVERADLRDLFFGYVEPNTFVAREVLSAMLIPIRQESVGNCFIISPLVAVSGNHTLIYVKHLFDATQQLKLIRTVSLEELKKYSFTADAEGRLRPSNQYIWEIPAFRAIYEALKIPEKQIPEFTKLVLNVLRAETLSVDKFLVELTDIFYQSGDEMLIDSLQSLYNSDAEMPEVVDLFKKSMSAFFDHVEHPLNNKVATFLASSNYSLLDDKRDHFVNHLRSVVNKGKPEDKPTSLAERYFDKHPKLSSIAEETKMAFDETLKSYINLEMFWLWNNELPQLSKSEDEQIKVLKRMHGGFSLFHQKYGSLDSPSAFKSFAKGFFEDLNKQFLAGLDENRRNTLLANDWNKYIQQLGMFFERDHNVSALQNSHHNNKNDSRVEQYLPWRQTSGDNPLKPVLNTFELESIVFKSTQYSSFKEFQRAYVKTLNSIPSGILQQISSSKGVLKLPVSRPSHGLNVFLYPKAPTLPKMPRLNLSVAEQNYLLFRINSVMGTNHKWDGVRTDLTVAQVRKQMKKLITDDYYTKDKKSSINYFEDDIAPSKIDIDRAIVEFCYDLKTGWRSSVLEALKFSSLDLKNPETAKNIQSVLDQDVTSVRALLLSDAYSQLVKSLTPEQAGELCSILTAQGCYPKAWYDEKAPAFDLNWRGNIYGYWVQNPVTEELGYVEMSQDGTIMTKVEEDVFLGKWNLLDPTAAYNMLSPNANLMTESKQYFLMQSFKRYFDALPDNCPIKPVEELKALVKKLEHVVYKPFSTTINKSSAKIYEVMMLRLNSIKPFVEVRMEDHEENWEAAIAYLYELVEFTLYSGTVLTFASDDGKKKFMEQALQVLAIIDGQIKSYCECLDEDCSAAFNSKRTLYSLAKMSAKLQERVELLDQVLVE